MLHDTCGDTELRINGSNLFYFQNKTPKATAPFSLPRYFLLHFQGLLNESDGCDCIEDGFLEHEK